jgi:4-amino-4-deoxy-L-arabinose transferase-like glycosyltransferase
MTPQESLRGRIVFDGTSTPTKTALFLLVCVAWLLPGLVGHDPWKVDEALVFGAVHEMLRGGDWLAFRVAGEPYTANAPLFLWTSALLAKLLGGVIPLHDAARLAAGLYMALAMAFLGLACRELLGPRAVRLGVLLLIGCVGLLIRAHEMNTDLAGLAGIAAALHGLALALRRPAAGGALAGVGAGVAFLGNGVVPLAMVGLTLVLLPLASAAWRTRDYLKVAAVAVACAAPLVAAWPAALTPWDEPAAVGKGMAVVYFLKTLPWYAWPAWPLAAWTLWRLRRSLASRPQLLLPLVAFVAFFVAIALLGEAREVNAMPLLLPLAILAVAEIDTLPRGAASALDWFGMSTFFLLGTLIWLAWIAALTGKPQFAVAWLQKEVPGFSYTFSFVAFALAALLTLLWLAVAAASLRSTRRALVNWAAGMTMVWMLMMTLGLPLVEQARSYRDVARRLAAELPAGAACIARHNLGDAQRALFDYFAGIRTVALADPGAARCPVLLLQGSRRAGTEPPAGWSEYWRGARRGDRNEYFALLRR